MILSQWDNHGNITDGLIDQLFAAIGEERPTTFRRNVEVKVEGSSGTAGTSTEDSKQSVDCQDNTELSLPSNQRSKGRGLFPVPE
jgi:hypothetical protein